MKGKRSPVRFQAPVGVHFAVIDREFEKVMRADRAGESFRGDTRRFVAARTENDRRRIRTLVAPLKRLVIT